MSNATNATPRKREEFGIRKQALFLDNIRKYGSVYFACTQAKVNKSTVYRHRESDPEFAKAWDDAKDDALDLLEATAAKRAHKSSDVLTMFLLKAGRPDKYREVIHQKHSGGDDGKPILVQPYDYRAAIAPLAPGPIPDSISPGKAKSIGDGQEMGEDFDGG